MIKATIRGCIVDAEMSGTIRTLENEISIFTVVATQRLAAVTNVKPDVLLQSIVSAAQRNINCKVSGTVAEIRSMKEATGDA